MEDMVKKKHIIKIIRNVKFSGYIGALCEAQAVGDEDAMKRYGARLTGVSSWKLSQT